MHGAPFGEPVLAVPSFTSGGVGYVGRLVERVLSRALGHAPNTVSLARGDGIPIALGDRLQFLARLIRVQTFGSADWAFFTHLGVARSQKWVPAASRRPYGVFLHGIEVWPTDLPADRVDAMRRATLRVGNSVYSARRVMESHPGVGPVLPCPLGLLPDEPSRTGTVDRGLLAQIGPHSALIVGRVNAGERYKGHDELLEAWPAVRAAVPDAQLVIAGTGDDVDRLRAKGAELGVSTHLLFAGFVSDETLNAMFDRVAVFAMPSRGEGFGLVYLQAMRAGVPCIGSTDDAAGDVIVHGETGFLVGQRDRAALVGSLKTLLTDDPLSQRMGAAGRARFAREFTFEHFERRLLAIFTEAFGAASPTGRLSRRAAPTAT